MRILFVDDETNLIRAMGRLLADDGHEVVGASTGGEALALADSQAFDGVLVDLHLTDMTGVEVIASLALAHPELHVAVITGGMSEEDAASLRGVPVIEKPFTAEGLVAFVNAHFGPKPTGSS